MNNTRQSTRKAHKQNTAEQPDINKTDEQPTVRTTQQETHEQQQLNETQKTIHTTDNKQKTSHAIANNTRR